MHLDSAIRVLLDGLADQPPVYTLALPDARRSVDDFVQYNAPAVDVARVQNICIPARSGQLSGRLYQATDRAGPVTVFLHGGGWVLGSIEIVDRTCRRLARTCGGVIVSVDYRLAPESPYPAALEDCYDATRWVADHLLELGGDGSFMAVAGESAGGNLAAAVALVARDEGTPRLDHQLLIYPVLDRDFDTPSYSLFGTAGLILDRPTMEWYWHCYLGDSQPDGYAAPLRAGSLSGLPAATVVLCELDPLQSEGHTYARRLAEAGVPVTLIEWSGLPHAALALDGVARRAAAFVEGIAHNLRNAVTMAS